MLAHVLLLEPVAGHLNELAAAFRSAWPTADLTSVPTLSALVTEVAAAPEATVAVVERDLGDGTLGGDAVVHQLRQRHPRVPVVLVARTGDVEGAQRAVAAGATDFLVLGDFLVGRVETLVSKLQGTMRLLQENRELRRAIALPFEIVGCSPAAKRVVELIERVARVPRPVLIQGERGTGKELVARAVHVSSRRSGLFVAINCAALAEPLLEAELFGYERGAFSGAERRTKGKFESADGGTLFLDEISHMPLAFQQKILRAVEYGSFLRVGGTQEIHVDTRVVAASNADLRQRISEGRFLPDLYDRLAFEVIRVPPLRERTDDIEPLAQHFMDRFGQEMPEFSGKRLSADAVEALKHYSFPGNVRELKNIIERAVYRETGAELTAAELEFPSGGAGEPSGTFKQRVECLERDLIEAALAHTRGNQAQAARELGLSYHQFRYFHSKHFGKRDPET